MSKEEIPEFYCPTDDTHDITDYEKSNENWKVQQGKCPVCGAQPKFRMVKNND